MGHGDYYDLCVRNFVNHLVRKSPNYHLAEFSFVPTGRSNAKWSMRMFVNVYMDRTKFVQKIFAKPRPMLVGPFGRCFGFVSGLVEQAQIHDLFSRSLLRICSCASRQS